MKKTDYVLLLISYVTLVYVFATGSTVEHYASNPVFPDYLMEGLGGLFGSFMITSIVTLPLQFFSGWDKHKYISKTIKGMLILSFISSLSLLG